MQTKIAICKIIPRLLTNMTSINITCQWYNNLLINAYQWYHKLLISTYHGRHQLNKFSIAFTWTTNHCPSKLLVSIWKHNLDVLTWDSHLLPFCFTFNTPRINLCRRVNYDSEIHSTTRQICHNGVCNIGALDKHRGGAHNCRYRNPLILISKKGSILTDEMFTSL